MAIHVGIQHGGNNTLVRLADLLKQSRFADLIGMKEDHFFDAKSGAAYDLTKEQGRYELAKDVSSFANENGGFVIVGLTTEILSTEKAEQVKSARSG